LRWLLLDLLRMLCGVVHEAGNCSRAIDIDGFFYDSKDSWGLCTYGDGTSTASAVRACNSRNAMQDVLPPGRGLS
jgi:hypothetical protein